jgi:hypothetical protein
VKIRKVRLRGKISENKLTGYWYDTDDRSGYFGAFQFVMHTKGRQMLGKWVGFSSDKTNVRHGEWELLIPE